MSRVDEEALINGWRGGAPRATNNSRELAKYVATGQCPTRGFCLAAGVSTDRLLKGTRFEVEFGQSPFAIQRGKKVEEAAERDDAAQIRGRAEELFGAYPRWEVFDVRAVRRLLGWDLAAEATREAVEKIVNADQTAPTLIFGATFAYRLKTRAQFYEADGLLVSPGGTLYVLEIKSFAKVANQIDGNNLGQALSQSSIYVVALRALVDELGGVSGFNVSDDVLVYTPENFRLRLAATRKSVERRARYTEEALRSMPTTADYKGLIPDTFTFGVVADEGRPEPERLKLLEGLARRVGTCFGPECLGNCGLFRFCRDKHYRERSLAVLGPEVTNLVPGAETWDDVIELSAAGASHLGGLAAVAGRLTRARRAVEEVHGPLRVVRRVRR